MNYGAEPADQVVRYSLEGMEYSLKITGNVAKHVAIFIAAALKDQKKTRGKTRLTRMLKEQRPITENDLKCLEEIQEKQKEVLEHYDITRFIQLDREFHTYIYQMSQNRELLKLLSNYYDMFRFMGMQAVMGTDKRRQTTIDEHQGILDALKQKNVEAAVQAMKIHMEETEKNINQNHAMERNAR